MNRQTWYVGAAFSTLVACAPWVANAQGPTPSSATGAGAAAKPGARPGAPAADEGPFSPKGKTGKLREQAEEVEEVEVKEKAVRKNGAAGVDFVLGTGKTGTSQDATEVFTASAILNARYFVTPSLRFGLMVPFATGHIAEKGIDPITSGGQCIACGDPYNVSAFGNVAVDVSYFLDRSERTDFGIDLTIAAPTSSGDRFGDVADRRAYVLNKSVIASRAYENRALFESKRFSMVPGASFGYHRRWLTAEAFTDVPLMIQTGGQEPRSLDPTVTEQVIYTINSLAVDWTIGGQAFANVISQRLDLGLRAFGTVAIVEPIQSEQIKPSKFQFVLEPQAVGKFGNLRVTLGVIWPIGGSLGDQTQIFGFRLGAGYLFQ